MPAASRTVSRTAETSPRAGCAPGRCRHTTAPSRPADDPAERGERRVGLLLERARGVDGEPRRRVEAEGLVRERLRREPVERDDGPAAPAADDARTRRRRRRRRGRRAGCGRRCGAREGGRASGGYGRGARGVARIYSHRRAAPAPLPCRPRPCCRARRPAPSSAAPSVAAVATAPRRAAAWAVVGVGMAGVAAARAAYVALRARADRARRRRRWTRRRSRSSCWATPSRRAARRRAPRPTPRAAGRPARWRGCWRPRACSRSSSGPRPAGASRAGGAVRSLTAAASGIVLGVAEATFVVLLVLGLRPLVLFRRGRWTVGLWRAALAAASSRRWRGRAAASTCPPAGPAVAFDARRARARARRSCSGSGGCRCSPAGSGSPRPRSRSRCARRSPACSRCARPGPEGSASTGRRGSGAQIPASYLLSRSVGGLASLGLGLGALYALTAGARAAVRAARGRADARRRAPRVPLDRRRHRAPSWTAARSWRPSPTGPSRPASPTRRGLP